MIRKLALAAASSAIAAPAHAHHSGAMFDSTQTVTLTGTVREFQFTNPHCYIQLTVRNPQGPGRGMEPPNGCADAFAAPRVAQVVAQAR